MDTGRERAIALITAAVNARYGDGDEGLFERALTEGLVITVVEDAMRELARVGTVLVVEAARSAALGPCEWWSILAQRLLVEGSEAEPPVVTLAMRAAYSLAECSAVAQEITDDGALSEGERDLVLSQLNETIDALRRLRRRIA